MYRGETNRPTCWRSAADKRGKDRVPQQQGRPMSLIAPACGLQCIQTRPISAKKNLLEITLKEIFKIRQDLLSHWWALSSARKA
jgi:hypothetical protein